MTQAFLADKVVYLHTRNDDGAVFYVGMGSFVRANSKWGRNKWWEKIAKKAGFSVQIYADGLTSKQAKELEIELIQSYKDQKKQLCNLTNGGDGRNGGSQPESFRISQTKFMLGNSFGLGKPSREPLYAINVKTGSVLRFAGRKSIENYGEFSMRQVYRCASRDSICKSCSIGVHRGHKFYWESDFLRNGGTPNHPSL